MKKPTPLVFSKPLNRDSYDEASSNSDLNHVLKPSDSERIIDRLDLQLLFSVIVFFVSAWAFLNSTICGFTESVPSNVQLSFMLVHYFLTLVLLLCIIITAIKGGYVLKKQSDDIQGVRFQAIQFFIESWFIILVLCLGILLTATVVPWYFWAVGCLALFYIKLSNIKVPRSLRLCVSALIVLFFPIFISTMTITIKDVTVYVDKEYYNLSDDIMVSMESKGYGCDYQLVGLGERELYPHTSYKLKKNSIIVPASTLKSNRISVGSISPASGIRAFFVYPFKKMTGKGYTHIADDKEVSPWLIYYKSKTVRIYP